jgi:phosphate transport system substrate-binding protein
MAALGGLALVATSPSAAVASGPTVTGAGSTWVQIALDQWRADIARQGYLINYEGGGSSAGRSLYLENSVDFAASEIPFQPDEVRVLAGENKHYQYIPDVAGGTSLMYNLHTPPGGRVTNLRLNADIAAKIYSGVITTWQDPAIAALNPGLQIRESRLIPVIRSDGSGTSAQFSLYLADQAPAVWNAFVRAQGCPAPCSLWPQFAGSINANGSDSVANFVANDSLGSGAIGYVEAGYAFGRGFPVASLHNASGYYTQPTSQNVATALTHATLYADLTQNLVHVYRAPEANAYPMSSYSYMILPCVVPASVVPTCSTDQPANFSAAKGFVLGTWIIYIACAGQREAAPLGYSPLPANLVQADMNAVNRLPGHPVTPPLDYQHCPNPNLYRAGVVAAPTRTSGGSAPAAAAGSGAAPAAQGGATAAGGGLSADPSQSSASAVLPPGEARVTVADAASRARLLDTALAAAARANGPSRSPLWIAIVILLLAVFTPMLVAAGRRRNRGG